MESLFLPFNSPFFLKKNCKLNSFFSLFLVLYWGVGFESQNVLFFS
ncbi:MAG: hypothetical protein RL757_1786 [Bacteroidota bacterium]|jgi:hypothetical protein